MNDRRSDIELLQRFTRQGEESAFADVVRRHLDLVFGTAMRKVGDTWAAQEVAQNVFAALARKAWRFAPDDSLPAWLYKAALLESKSWLRGELGRRRREETAAELGTTMKTPEDQPAFNTLVPLLDQALLSLREKDRTALLLRYYESQSLRDVGAAFGVSEDTARKRVQSALETLSEFFKRRGFKTATVAAAAAALQHTAASASAGLASTVVRAAIQAAPPALAGLGAWLARLCSLSRVQTAGLCVALASAPVGWQLNERRAANEAAKRFRVQLLGAQNELATVQTEIERLRAVSGRLEQSVAQKNEAAARAAESAQAFAAWKKRMRGLLTAADYRWSDDSPFVRIPKSVLPELSKSSVGWFGPPGVVMPWGRELLGLSSPEEQSLEEALQRDIADMEGRLGAGIYETNEPSRFTKAALAGQVFVVPVLGDEAKQLTDPMLAELHGIFGEERWPLVQTRLEKNKGFEHGGMDCLDWNGRSLAVWVEADHKGTLKMGYIVSGGIATYGSGALAMFLPEGDPNREDGFQNTIFGGHFFSKPLRERALAWLQEQAIARLGKGASR
jgi:RNA polymerase sigma factor (sigma-70 family)